MEKAHPGDIGINDLVEQAKQIDSKVDTVCHLQVIVDADLISPTSCQIESLLNIGLGLEKDNREKPLYIALKTFSKKLKNLRSQARADVSHHDKRNFVSYDCIFL